MQCPFVGEDQHDQISDPFEESYPSEPVAPPARKKKANVKKEVVEARVNEQLREVLETPGEPAPGPVDPIPTPPYVPPVAPGRQEPSRVPVPAVGAAAAVNRVSNIVPRRYKMTPAQELALRGWKPRAGVLSRVRLPRLSRAQGAAAIAEKVVTRQLVSPRYSGAGSEISEGAEGSVGYATPRSRAPRGFGFGFNPTNLGIAAAAGGGGGFLINAAARMKRMLGVGY